MHVLIPILQITLPFLYAGLVWLFAEIFFRSGETRPRVRKALPIVFITLALHALYIGLYTMEQRHCLLTTIFELCSLIAFTLLAIYSFVEIRITKEASGTGFLVAIVAFLFQTVSSLFIEGEATRPYPPIMSDAVFNIHVTSAVFGYASLTLATVYGALYLLLFRAMKKNQFGPVFEHLPNLERLERYGIRSTAVGFTFLSISIALGWMLMKDYPPAYQLEHFFLDSKILATFLIWAVFGLTLLVRRVARVEGRKLVLLWMSGFALTLISMTIVNAFTTNFHSFL